LGATLSLDDLLFAARGFLRCIGNSQDAHHPGILLIPFAKVVEIASALLQAIHRPERGTGMSVAPGYC